jgi:uncharacterized protein YndB with AHSA1/START domain
MKENLIAESSIIVNAPPEKVWRALTDPALVKHYLFGTDMETTWEVGSPILYKGEWKGQPYEDKGTVLAFEPNKRIETSYWSAAFGPDVPENRKKVVYMLQEHSGGTKLTIIQDNNRTETSKAESEGNWNVVLDGLKKIVENM